MKSRKFVSNPVSLLFIAASGAFVAAAAMGQAMEIVTVEAVREVIVGKSSTGVPIKELSVRSSVSYADLDLTTETGVAALKKRVEDTAKSNCKEIKVEVPAEGSTVEKCIKDALGGATPQIDKAIADAKAAKK